MVVGGDTVLMSYIAVSNIPHMRGYDKNMIQDSACAMSPCPTHAKLEATCLSPFSAATLRSSDPLALGITSPFSEYGPTVSDGSAPNSMSLSVGVRPTQALKSPISQAFGVTSSRT